MEPLKHMFTPLIMEESARVIGRIIPDFDEEVFLKQVFERSWEQKELKARYQHIAKVLWTFMPKDYSLAVDYLIGISLELGKIDHHQTYGAFPYMFLPTCVEFYGLDDFGNSMRGFEKITQLISAEFAVRPFFVNYPEKMLAQSMKWTKHKSEHVRRLASEGARPALPWGMALTQYKKNPTPLIPLLENLKNDESLFVRKSVANNLNDISKTHPELVIALAGKWKGKTERTDWIVKHASRTLLKAGNPEIMHVFGYASTEVYTAKLLETTEKVKMGEVVEFSFSVTNNSPTIAKTRIEYALYFLKQKEKYGKKVFMISDTELSKESSLNKRKQYSFKPISTRKYYVGKHYISIIINGVELAKTSFELID